VHWWLSLLRFAVSCRLQHELSEFRDKLSHQQDISRKELQEQERYLQQQYAEREASFQAELDAWDSKVCSGSGTTLVSR
jgi:hypothetical protein